MSGVFDQKISVLIEKHKIFICLCIVALIILGVVFSNVFSVAAFILFAFVIFFAREEFVICLFLFLMSFASLFKLSSDAFSFFTICEIFLIVRVFLKRKFSLFVLISAVVYFSYLCLGTVLRGQSDYIEHIKQAENILMLYCLVVLTKNVPIEKIATYFILGMLLSSFVGIFAQNNPIFIEYARNLNKETGDYIRFCGLMGDPNYYSVNLIFVFAFLLLLRKKEKISIEMFWLFFIVFSVFGIMTYSKSFILMYVLIFIITAVIVLKKMNPIENVLLLVAFVAIIIALSQGGMLSAFDRITSSGNMDELTTGRYSIWERYIKFIFDDTSVILFGTGLTSGLLGTHGTHNIFIESIYYIGFVGVIILVAGIYFTLKSVPSTNKKTPFNYFGWIVMALMYFFLQALFSYVLIYNIFFAYLIYSTDFKQKEKVKKESVNQIPYYDYGYNNDED